MADDYPRRPVPFTDVRLAGGFWRGRIEPGRIDHFSKNAGEMAVWMTVDGE